MKGENELKNRVKEYLRGCKAVMTGQTNIEYMHANHLTKLLSSALSRRGRPKMK